MTQANCFFCSDRTTIERFGKPYAVQCVNASCGAIGPLRERRCDAVEAWNGVAARLDMPVQQPPMWFVRSGTRINSYYDAIIHD